MLCERRLIVAKNFLSNISLDPIQKESSNIAPVDDNSHGVDVNFKLNSLNSLKNKSKNVLSTVSSSQTRSQKRYYWNEFKEKMNEKLDDFVGIKNVGVVSDSFQEPSFIVSSIIPFANSNNLHASSCEDDLKKGTYCGLIALQNQSEFLVKQPNLFLYSFCPTDDDEISLITILKPKKTGLNDSRSICNQLKDSKETPGDKESYSHLTVTSLENFPILTTVQANSKFEAKSFDILSQLPPLCYIVQQSKRNSIINILKGPMCYYMLNGNNKCPYDHSLLFKNKCINRKWIRIIQLMNGEKSTEQIIDYPDPLLYYDPSLLDNFNNVLGTDKMTLSMPSYRSTVLLYTKHSDFKRNINRTFHESFPAIQLTLSKFRSLKQNMSSIVSKLNIDFWILAHAFVLFEKLILKLMIDSVNRKACAAACLLIGAKLNDVKGTEMMTLIQESESIFRISRSEIFKTELAVSVALKFQLIPSDLEILPHFLVIQKHIGQKTMVFENNQLNSDPSTNHNEPFYLRSISSGQSSQTYQMKYTQQLSYPSPSQRK